MRILHVVPSYFPAVRYGGPIFSVHGLCKALVLRGHEVHVFTTNVDGPVDSPVPVDRPVELDGVQVSYFHVPALRRLFWSLSMANALKVQVPRSDIVHVHSVFLWPTWAAARSAHKFNVPYILSPRGMLVKELIRRKSPLLKKSWISLVERRNVEHAAAIHATSGEEVRELRAFNFRNNNVVVIPNGVDSGETGRATDAEELSGLRLPAHEPVLLFLGRISWKKGLDRLIAALKFVPRGVLVIAGNDEEHHTAKLEQIANGMGLRERIIFAGPAYSARKSALFRRATVFVLPSYSENFGNVVLEAMAAGCPVAVTEGVGAATIVIEAGGGVVLPGTPDKLGAGLAKLLSDPDLSKMSERGREFVSRRYTWDVIGEQMEKLYEQILLRAKP